MKVTVVGGGSFGTVMANIAAGNGYPVSFWMRSDSLAAAINRCLLYTSDAADE